MANDCGGRVVLCFGDCVLESLEEGQEDGLELVADALGEASRNSWVGWGFGRIVLLLGRGGSDGRWDGRWGSRWGGRSHWSEFGGSAVAV